MSDSEDLELQALQRQLDDAFETTRPRPGFEDELWTRMQARRPVGTRLRDAWMGLIAPGGTPAAIIMQIHADVVGALRTQSIRDKLATQLMEPVGSSPAEFRIYIAAEIGRWAPVIKAGNIKVN